MELLSQRKVLSFSASGEAGKKCGEGGVVFEISPPTRAEKPPLDGAERTLADQSRRQEAPARELTFFNANCRSLFRGGGR